MFLRFLVQGSTPFKLTASTCASKSPKDLSNQTSSSSWKRQPKGPSGLQDFAANPFLKPPTGESWVSSPWSSALRVDIYFVVVDYAEFLFVECVVVLFQSCQVSFQCAWPISGVLEIDGFVHLWVGISTGIMHLVSNDGLSKWKIVELTVESPGATRPHVPWCKISSGDVGNRIGRGVSLLRPKRINV